MEKHSVHINGIDMVYEECGQENERTIFLIHGFCGSSRYWHKVCPLLSESYRVIMPQLRGHGESSSPDGIYKMDLMADDMVALMDKLELDKVAMFGHSLGGYVTLAVAERYSDRLCGFGLIHSTALPDTEDTISKRRKDIEAIRSEGITTYVNKLIPNLFNKSKLNDMKEDVDQIIEVGLQMKPEAAIHTLEGMMQRPNRSTVLTDATFPILLVAGAEDDVIASEATFTVTESGHAESTYKYPHIVENTFEGVAHMSLIEAPDQLARTIANYLKTLYEKEAIRVV